MNLDLTKSSLSLIQRMTIVFSFIFFCGFVHLLSYYNEFGFRYSDLDLEYYHIFYRGMILIRDNYVISILAVSLFITTFFNFAGFKIKLWRWYAPSQFLSETIIVLLFVSSWPASVSDGFRSAQRDGSLSTSLLRELVSLKDKNGDDNQHFKRLKGAVGNGTVYIVRMKSGVLSVIAPPQGILPGALKPSITHIKLSSGDIYVEASSPNNF